ncbi:hypothetical protein D3C76_1186390 [compost metagenome]
MFRVNRAAIAIQQAGAPEKPGTIPHPSQFDAQLGRPVQEAYQLIVRLEGCTITATNHQQIQLLNCGQAEARIGANDQTQIADHLAFGQTEGCRREQLRP